MPSLIPLAKTNNQSGNPERERERELGCGKWKTENIIFGSGYVTCPEEELRDTKEDVTVFKGMHT